MNIAPWLAINGDKTLRLSYEDLNSDSIVFDLGGFEGKFTSDIQTKYGCICYVFEPIKSYYDNIVERFKNNHKVHPYNFGLAAKNSSVLLTLSNDGTSQFRSGKDTEKVSLKSFSDFMLVNKITSIDLLKVNIEGGEYDLFEECPDVLLESTKHIQVQFHELGPNSSGRMLKIQERFEQTHILEWQYPFVWESWRLK